MNRKLTQLELTGALSAMPPVLKPVEPAHLLRLKGSTLYRHLSEGRYGGAGSLSNWHPVPRPVEQTPEAKEVLRRLREDADEQYSRAEAKSDLVGMAIWAQASEKARRLALAYACSENHLAHVFLGLSRAYSRGGRNRSTGSPRPGITPCRSREALGAGTRPR